MKTTNDNPVDPLGSLGSPIRPAAPPAPDPVREFEHISDTNKALETIAETLRKQLGQGWQYGMPVIHIDDEDGAYLKQLGCI